MDRLSYVLLGQAELATDRSMTLIIVGSVLLLLGLAGGAIIQKFEIKLGKYASVGVGALGVLLLVIGLSGLAGAPEIPCPSVAINTPSSNARMPRDFAVSGTSSGKMGEWSLWLVVNPVNEEGWWPQGARLTPVPPNGSWRRQVYLGGTLDQHFQIGVACASPEADRDFVAYLEEGQRTGEYPGRTLPVGARILTAVEVIQHE
jgi:hypothetical protein